MTAPEKARCEVCRACLSRDRPRRDLRRCAEHVEQQTLFPLSALRPGGGGRARKDT